MSKANTKTFSPARYYPTVEDGLNNEQINERITNNLTNCVKKSTSKSYLNIFYNNVCTFFNFLGLVVCLSLIFVQAPIGDFFFVVIYLANMGIGIIQEIRAKRCINKLSLVSSKTTKAVRNGKIVEIASSDIVLDDVLILGIGNQIPTDSTILEGEIEVNESLLTGESVPVKKKVGDTLYAGSFITAGVCTVIAYKVGKDNYVEKLTKQAKQYKKPNSQLMNSLKFIIKCISCAIVPFAIALLVKSLVILDVDIAPAISRTATSVIGMIPSGMFLLTSLALALGIIKLARHNTLVQDLYSLEMLARVDTICFDKTGTITDGNMTVKDVVYLNGYTSEINKIVSSMLGSLAGDNQTAQALAKYFGKEITEKAISTLPFNSKRKLSAVTFESKQTFAFGAPEFVLQKSEYQKLEGKINAFASEGLRVLVLAKSTTELKEDFVPNDFSPVALILIVDNIREDAIATINWFKENGVQIKVISGDNPITVSEVSKRVGIEGADRYVSLEGLTDDEVAKVANDYTVFGRVSPEQKAILVKAMKEAGHVTAMTGDGVNDILALKESDCAISVAAGSDAAKNISHIVLMDNNFNSMPKVVHEGRRVINNVQSSATLFLMKTMFTMVITILTLCLYEKYPFTLSNMILLEVFVIGLPAFFLSMQPNDSRVEGKFINHVITKSVPSAILMILSVVVIACLGDISSNELYKTMAVLVLTYSGIINLLNICSPLNKFRSILFFANLAIVLIGTIVILTNANVSQILGLISLIPFVDNWKNLLIVGVIIILNVPLSFLLSKLAKIIQTKPKKDNI